jgi:hypothetical protein
MEIELQEYKLYKNNVEYLKTLGTPHYFGLGFIQLKLNKYERIHFYHPELMPILDDEEIHDHRYTFRSRILKGSLTNEIFVYDSMLFTDLGLFEVSCSMEDAGKPPHFLKEVDISMVCSFSLTEGSEYALSADAFHRIKYHEPTITYLTRGEIIKDYARIIKPVVAPDVCPFSKKMDEAELWDIIEKIIYY